ncbi:type II CRISPR RNA-guided endonuclease Cas9 [Roseimaritima sediminicola]|uniref:type II CRISPR RNA-guided endonuclease Cas9 n=1 Tax=Roseimaritima sediminicola TaxID=2662066 RepID=UPI0013867CB3|nr:type II CRISPR RNA-guided endonuclease Cas9 [Roseimaritima sediminicola]
MGSSFRYVLGLDLGVSSAGWAILELDSKNGSQTAVAIRDAGVRIFDAGVEGDVEQGKDSSRATVRRQARQPRRQHWRRQFRKKKLFKELQQHGLLPESSSAEAAERKKTLDAVDAELIRKHVLDSNTSDVDKHLAQQRLPYLLRAKALDGPLNPHELGRALYSLAQRRGYKSNRKADIDDDTDGEVAQSIEAVSAAAVGQTLGQFFAREVNPFDNRVNGEGKPDAASGRFRRRYTARDMFTDEFDRIRVAQSPHHQLSDADWERVRQIIFFQRPLKSQKRLIGKCSLEPSKRRCAEALPIFQEFRILQQVNHLRVRDSNGLERPLDERERELLIDALQTQGSMSMKSRAKTLLGIPKPSVFTMEEWDDKLIGHRTNQQMLNAFGDRWFEFSDEERHAIVSDVLFYRHRNRLKQRARNAWGLDPEHAEILAGLHLEEGYANLSALAIKKLLPAMRDGLAFSEAREQVYGDSFKAGEAFDRLPPVVQWNKDIRNPAVMRALTEMRKVVNALIDRYGKPDLIRIELARDLKNSRDGRKRLWANSRDNQKRREKAKEGMLAELGIGYPSRIDIQRWMLGVECNRQCPYCGTNFSGSEIVGKSGNVNIEHIYPRRYLDNSFTNKTLACRRCNDRKGDKLPTETFTNEELALIIERVKAFKGPHRVRKLQRMQATEVPEDFVSRDLNDTRYFSRLATEYVGILYGGHVDALGRRRVYTPTGGLTALIRRGWGLNAVLSDANEKNRNDHRHHAVDAIIVALSTQDRVHDLSRSASQADSHQQRDTAFLKHFEVPWPGFVDEVRRTIENILVSHRPTRTMGGRMHAESIYSIPHYVGGKKEFRIRKELKKLTEKEINGDQIADPGVREAVQQRWAKIKAENAKAIPAQVWSDPRTQQNNFPRLRSRATGKFDGTPIFKVRMRVRVKPRSIGKGVRERNVASGKDTNFACLIYGVMGKDGNEKKWEHEVIDRQTAYQRLANSPRRHGERILVPDEQGGRRRFQFAIRKNDCLELDDENGDRAIYRVVNISADEIQLSPLNLPRVEKEDRNKWNRVRSTTDLKSRNARPVEITPAGQVSEID